MPRVNHAKLQFLSRRRVVCNFLLLQGSRYLKTQVSDVLTHFFKNSLKISLHARQFYQKFSKTFKRFFKFFKYFHKYLLESFLKLLISSIFCEIAHIIFIQNRFKVSVITKKIVYFLSPHNF